MLRGFITKKRLIELLALLSFCSTSFPAMAGKADGAIQSEIDSINVQLEFLKIKVSDNKKKTNNLEKRIKDKKDEIKSLSSQITLLTNNQEETQIHIKKLEQDNAESRRQLKELLNRFRGRLVQLHKIKQGTLVSSVLFAKDLNSFLSRYQMVKYLLESDKDLIESLKANDEKVRKTTKILVEKNSAFEKGKTELADKQKQLAKEEATLAAMLNTVLVEKKLLLKREKELAAARKDLEKQVEEAIKVVSKPEFEKELEATPAKKQKPATTDSSSVAKQEAVPTTPQDAAKIMNMIWPISKELRSQVAEIGDENSQAILIKPLADAEVMAVTKGKVLYKGLISGLGDVVIIGHQKGFSSVYARLDNVWVGLNEVVDKGAVIGKINGGGSESALHFEIRFGGKKMPPLQYLSE